MNILAAGDNFMLSSLLAAALRLELGDEAEVREITLPWPGEPWSDVGEVKEASGTEEELIQSLYGAKACVTHLAPLTEKVLASCPDLELIGVARGGPVNINVEAATRHGVVVCNTPGKNAAAVAEYTIGLMLASLRRITEGHTWLAQGEWRGDLFAYDKCGFELAGTTVGLIGLGEIGKRVARLLHAFDATVLAYDPYASAAGLDEFADRVGLEELLRRSRIVSLHARVATETEGMIGPDELAAMPPGSVLINTARGSLVDHVAVCDALNSGHLAAAALDVFDAEPLPPDSCLLKAPNVVMTPHLAGASRQTVERGARTLAEEVRRFVRGEPLQHCINTDVLR